MRFHALVVCAVVMFAAGATLTFFFPFGTAAGGSGQSHPGVEICDSSLCVTRAADGTTRVGIGTSSPSHSLDVNDLHGGKFSVESADSSGTVQLHLRNENNPAAPTDWFIINGVGKLQIADDPTRIRANFTTTGLEVAGDVKVGGKIIGGECGLGTFVGYTSVGYDGNDGKNYSYANTLCSAVFAGSHMCSTEEISRSIRCGKTWDNNQESWYNTFTYNIVDVSQDQYTGLVYAIAQNDCSGWSSTNGAGATWDTAGTKSVETWGDCSTKHPYMCCG